MIESIAKRVAPGLCALLQSGATVCGNTGCRSHPSFWQTLRKEGLYANGSWFCSPGCLAERIYLDCSRRRVAPRTATRMPLGMILLAQGAITESGLRCALAAPLETDERIGSRLAGLGLVNTKQVTSALATQWQCPAIENVPHLSGQASVIPLGLMRHCRMVPLGTSSETTVRIMFDGPIDHGVLYAIDEMLGCRTVPCISSPSVLEEMLCRAVDQARDVEVEFGHAEPDAMARIAANYAAEFAAGEIRYVSFGGRFWMRIPRVAGAVNLVFFQTQESERQVLSLK